MAERDTGGRPEPEDGEPTQDDDDAPAPRPSPPPSWAELGRTVGASITVLAALGGLVLGVRAEQRADRAERQAAQTERRSFAEQVDFYGTSSDVVVTNGNPHAVYARLLLPERKLWWQLGGLPPCRKVSVPRASLRAGMRARSPSTQVTDADLSSLVLEFTDPDNRSWIRGGGGALGPSQETPAARGLRMVDLSESWNRSAQVAPMCGAH
ncbi:hypothetical protein ACF1BE_13830 [Streptomyces sp. NPDC014991]|uniref:hypothetical protein n=1 Tax=Streptomyces sp. NPDC014991 TaxID=3364935 RepID=UPI00370203AD